MRKELQDKLYEKYPKIFVQKDLDMQRTAMCWGIACGDGWYNILEVLCGELQNYVDSPHRDVELYSRFIENSKLQKDNEAVELWEQKLRKAKQSIIPQIEAVQVKEKFGTLRFYTNEYDDTINSFISFAESMSACTCEECGAPGTPDPGGWVKTRCVRCKGEA